MRKKGDQLREKTDELRRKMKGENIVYKNKFIRKSNHAEKSFEASRKSILNKTINGNYRMDDNVFI